MRLIHARVAESHADSDSALYARAKSDQLLNIRLLAPLLIALNLVSAFAIWRWPDLFIARAGHIWLISAQLVAFVGYLVYTGHYFSAIAPLVLRTRQTS
jgi:thiosulfate reductase cytochrome b subunit